MNKGAVPAEKMAAQSPVTLDDSRAFQGMTAAQHRMVLLLFTGLSQVDAYRAVYDTDGRSDGAVQVAASVACRQPIVVAKINEMRQRVEAQSTLAPNLNRAFVLNGLMGLAINATKESVQLGAYQTLGKTVGIDLFRDTVVTEKRTRTVEDVERELRDRLAELQATLTVEGEARRVPSEAPAQKIGSRTRKPIL